MIKVDHLKAIPIIALPLVAVPLVLKLVVQLLLTLLLLLLLLLLLMVLVAKNGFVLNSGKVNGHLVEFNLEVVSPSGSAFK